MHCHGCIWFEPLPGTGRFFLYLILYSKIFYTIFADMKAKAEILIAKHSKSWLAEQLSLTRPTLDVRLKKGNWKRIEVEKILKLSK